MGKLSKRILSVGAGAKDKSLGRGQCLKVFQTMDPVLFIPALFRDFSDKELYKAFWLATGIKPNTPMSAFHAETKRDFRTQCKGLWRIRVSKEPCRGGGCGRAGGGGGG